MSLNMKPIPLDDYHIGIICALTIERAAMVAMLDEKYGIIQGIDPKDHNAYFAGRIHSHHVVIACLPAGMDVIAPAANVATNMRRTFRQLWFGLLVGIGGGIPDLDNEVDIRLGDVVVGQPRGRFPGVVQHDKDKHEAGNPWDSESTLDTPLALLRALQLLRTEHESAVSKMAMYMAQMLARNTKMKAGYGYPGAQEDVYYLSTDSLEAHVVTEHPGNTTIVIREERPMNSSWIYYGTIASGNSVIKDSVKRDQLRRDYGALCVETEAAGFINDFPCLVIRGICDYADQHKNDKWQRYAAATAAAFSKELLLYVSEQTTIQCERASVLMDGLTPHFQLQQGHNQVQEAFYQRQEISQKHDKYRNCHQVFSTSDYEGNKNIIRKPASGTCRWVLDDPSYLDWCHNPETDLLWISADPGCGKSVLLRHLVDSSLSNTDESNFEQDKSHTTCYFFFKDKETQDRLVMALSALLHQLFSQQSQLIRHAIPAYDQKGEKLPNHKDELWRVFQSAARDPEARPIVCFLDALDECNQDDRQRLIDLIGQSRMSASSMSPGRGIKWLITSRPYNDIQCYFGRIPSSFEIIQLRGEDKNDQIREEINLVIHEQMNEMTRELSLPKEKAEEITQQLLAMENRTYLWLYLAMGEIRKAFSNSLRPATESIIELPTSVEAAYENILSRIDKSMDRSQVRAILTIVVGARRPLTISEMALALDIATLREAPRRLNDLTVKADHIKKNIREWCGLFIFINHDRLYLIHQTAKEFLLCRSDELAITSTSWKHCLSPVAVDRDMARICVLFLCLEDLVQHVDCGNREPKTPSESKEQDALHSSVQSFFIFAAGHWAEYVRMTQAILDSTTQSGIKTLYDSTSEQFPRWTSAMWRTNTRGYRKFDMNMIQLAAFNGHSLFLRHLLNNASGNIDAQDSAGEFTALTWAAVNGHADAADVLLDFGADIDGPGGRTYYSNALLAASLHGHLSVVELLLDRGANINARRAKYNDTALHAASRWGHQEVVERLLSDGAEMVAHDLYGSALEAASADGHRIIVELLIDNGADVNAHWERFPGNALQRAAAGGHQATVKLLLDKGADINARDANESALQSASAEGHQAIVELLLNEGANINAQGGKKGSALIAASASGHQKIVEVLLKNGANINARWEKHYGSALQAAGAGGHQAIVELLLNEGADDCYPQPLSHCRAHSKSVEERPHASLPVARSGLQK